VGSQGYVQNFLKSVSTPDTPLSPMTPRPGLGFSSAVSHRLGFLF
jgi:hypothetical protein